MAVGKHKYNWELELDAGRGPGTYNYEDAKGGIIKKSNDVSKRIKLRQNVSDEFYLFINVVVTKPPCQKVQVGAFQVQVGAFQSSLIFVLSRPPGEKVH